MPLKRTVRRTSRPPGAPDQVSRTGARKFRKYSCSEMPCVSGKAAFLKERGFCVSRTSPISSFQGVAGAKLRREDPGIHTMTSKRSDGARFSPLHPRQRSRHGFHDLRASLCCLLRDRMTTGCVWPRQRFRKSASARSSALAMRSQAMSIVSRVQISGGDRIIVSPVARIIMPCAIAWSRTTTAALPDGR